MVSGASALDVALISSISENSVDNAFRLIDGVRKDIHNDNPAEKVYRREFRRNFRCIAWLVEFG